LAKVLPLGIGKNESLVGLFVNTSHLMGGFIY